MRIAKVSIAALAAVVVMGTSVAPAFAFHHHQPKPKWERNWHKDIKPKAGTPAVAPTFAANGNNNDAPSHAGGVRPEICETSGPTSGYNRPGGFCDIAANPRSLSGRAVGFTVVSPGTPGTPGQAAMFWCKTEVRGPDIYGYYSNVDRHGNCSN